jgi:hypothetical protein
VEHERKERRPPATWKMSARRRLAGAWRMSTKRRKQQACPPIGR